MKKMNVASYGRFYLLVLIGMMTCQIQGAESPGPYAIESKAELDARMEWWRDARFGMFIHWGIYAVPEGEWKGDKNHGEWIRRRAGIPQDIYNQFADQFNPVEFDADAWVCAAKGAGMKYLVITAKHHDGFCMWPSSLTRFDIESTPFKRDPLGELAEACKKYGIKLGLYYSIMDWHHPNYDITDLEDLKVDRSSYDIDMDKYTAYMKGQLKELIERYDPAIFWFDGEWDDAWTHQAGIDLYNYLRSLKPNLIINNRVDKGRKGNNWFTQPGTFRGDYGTPEQQIPATGLDGLDWESCMTMNAHWGWNKYDDSWKSGADLVHKLIEIASKGGNFLLNVGPKPDGTFPQESIDRLAFLGEWLGVNGESIYGTTASPFHRISWGYCTKKLDPKGAVLYLHVIDWPKDEKKLMVPGLKNVPLSATILKDGTELKMQRVLGDEPGLLIQIPKNAPDPFATVIALEIAGELQVEANIPKQSRDGTLTLDPVFADLHSEGHGTHVKLEKKDGKTTIGQWKGSKGWFEWKFKVDQPGTFVVQAQLASAEPSIMKWGLADTKMVESAVEATADEGTFETRVLGEITIPKAGMYHLEFRAPKDSWKPISVGTVVLAPAPNQYPVGLGFKCR